MQVIDRSTEHQVPQNVLEHNVKMSMQSQGYMRMRDVGIVAEGGTVTLFGKVKSFFLKQLAQEVSRNVPGVVRIVNEIEVSHA